MAQILVVDRTLSVRESLAFVLEMEGHTVAQAAGGHAALDALALTPTDLIVVDPQLRDMPFDTFCAALRRLAPAVRVVVMSLSDADSAATGSCAPAAFLAKPFAAPQLLAVVAG